jgi:hypothetical protein
MEAVYPPVAGKYSNYGNREIIIETLIAKLALQN